MSVTRATTQLVKSRNKLKTKIADLDDAEEATVAAFKASYAEKRIKLQGELVVIEKTLQTLGYVDVAESAGESSSEAEVNMLAAKRL